MVKKYSSGFIAVVPLLVIAAVAVIALSFKNGASVGGSAEVLSESDSKVEKQRVEDQKREKKQMENLEASRTLKPESREESVNSDRTPKPTGEMERIEAKYEYKIRRSTPKPLMPAELRTPKPLRSPESGDEVESEDGKKSEEELEVEVETKRNDGVETAKIKLKEAGRVFEYERQGEKVEVKGDFPISINSETNQLTVTTPKGDLDVAILPDKAVENILSSGQVSEVEKDSTGRKDVRIVKDAEGNAVYEVRGVKTEKLLGLIRVPIAKTARISIKDGSLVSVSQSLTSKFLDLVSF